MSNNAANEQQLGKLHALLTQKFLMMVQETEDPRVLNAIAKFLKDNNVTMEPFEDEALSELEKQLRQRSRRFADIADEAKRAASDSIH